jgi:hypothetical protein
VFKAKTLEVAPFPPPPQGEGLHGAIFYDYMDQLSSISGATGLSLSTSTLRNLRRLLLNEDQFEKLDPSYCNYKVFQEVLAVDSDLFKTRIILTGFSLTL